jgi:hypothetical protein
LRQCKHPVARHDIPRTFRPGGRKISYAGAADSDNTVSRKLPVERCPRTRSKTTQAGLLTQSMRTRMKNGDMWVSIKAGMNIKV